MDIDLVEKFNTPPVNPFTEYDKNILSNAENIEIPFEGDVLKGYCWGKGKTVLLVHGWGSRASHMAYLGRFLSDAGFRVITYDAPAHSSYKKEMKKATSNMFECSRAVYSVEKYVGPLYAVIGHSLGAACACFTAAGFLKLKDYKITAEKLILISPPPSITSMIVSFCRNHKLDYTSFLKIKETHEKTFNFSADEYCIKAALPNISADKLIVHDVNDEEFPISDIYTIHQSNPDAKLFVTEGSGHKKILTNKKMMIFIQGYLKKER